MSALHNAVQRRLVALLVILFSAMKVLETGLFTGLPVCEEVTFFFTGASCQLIAWQIIIIILKIRLRKVLNHI